MTDAMMAFLKEQKEEDVIELASIMTELGFVSLTHVSEIYSPPRLTAMCKSMGLNPGFALDLTVLDPDDGMPWDFTLKSKRDKARQKVIREKPILLVGSPMCTVFSRL